MAEGFDTTTDAYKDRFSGVTVIYVGASGAAHEFTVKSAVEEGIYVTTFARPIKEVADSE